MASQRDQQHLKKVGLEGLELIDECYGRIRRSNQSQRFQSPQPHAHESHYQLSFYYHVQHQQSYTQVYTVTKKPATSYSGTSQHHYYGGRGISDGGQEVFVAKKSAVFSNEAAQFYGGTMATDYSKNKPLGRAYY